MVFENLSQFRTGKSDEEPEDVIRALENPEYPQIPHDLLESGLPHVPHAAHDLDALVHHKPGRLRAHNLGDGGLQVVVLVARVHRAGHHVGHRLCHVVQHRHPGYLLLDGAVGVDLGAELGPPGGVGDRLRDDLPHGAGQGGAHPEAAVVQDLQMK